MGSIFRNGLAIGAWVMALAFSFVSAGWPEYIRPHPYAVVILFVAGLVLFVLPLLRRGSWAFETNRPRLMLTAQDGNPFMIVHLGGGAAQHIQIEPISSALGKNIWVRFDAVDFLSAAKPEAHPYFRLDLHGFGKPHTDMALLRAALFHGDSVGRQTVDYPVNISFHWNGKPMMERHTLTWHSATKTLTTSEASK